VVPLPEAVLVEAVDEGGTALVPLAQYGESLPEVRAPSGVRVRVA
jgi:hypothetical protein